VQKQIPQFWGGEDLCVKFKKKNRVNLGHPKGGRQESKCLRNLGGEGDQAKTLKQMRHGDWLACNGYSKPS